MSGFAVRYIVDDVEKAAEFYCRDLGFDVEMGPGPGFVALRRDDLRLFLNQPGAGGAGASLPDGTAPRPGGWARFQLSVADLDAEVSRLAAAGAHFRGDVATGRGGRQILLEDPSGNVVELFEPAG
jgi:catechol 2,3-dioxygenase-like lactoylglutathione lyase family enzyme